MYEHKVLDSYAYRIPLSLVTKTSEKTIEVNILHDLCKCLESKGKRVTIISPTQREENKLGFDDMFEGLPAGRVLALQFKRPSGKDSSQVKFHIPKYQLGTLLRHFSNIAEAYYVFSPFPKVNEISNHRDSFLSESYILDIQSKFLKNFSKTQSMTLKIEKAPVTKFYVIDNRISYHITNLQSASTLCPQLIAEKIGRVFNIQKIEKWISENKIKEHDRIPSKTTYIHVSNKS